MVDVDKLKCKGAVFCDGVNSGGVQVSDKVKTSVIRGVKDVKK